MLPEVRLVCWLPWWCPWRRTNDLLLRDLLAPSAYQHDIMNPISKQSELNRPVGASNHSLRKGEWANPVSQSVRHQEVVQTSISGRGR
eukprot:4280236-Amphidinium_carterae.1